MQAVEALATAGIHLVRHGRGADLAGRKAFAGQLVARHEAEGFGKAAGAAGQLIQGTDALEV